MIKFLNGARAKLFLFIIITAMILSNMTAFTNADTVDGGEVAIINESSHIAYGRFETSEGESYEGNFFHVVGEVENVSEDPLNYWIEIRFYDVDGKQIVGPKWELGYPFVIGVGQKYPFKIVLLDEDISTKVARYELFVLTDFPILKVEETPGWGKSSSFYAHQWVYPYIPTFLNVALRDGQLVGEFENNDNDEILHFIENVTVWATYYDEDGNVIDADQAHIYNLIDLGQKLPFRVMPVPENISGYNLSVAYERTNRIPYMELQILNHQLKNINNSFYLVGEIENSGKLDAKTIEVWATYHDAAGKVVDYEIYKIGELPSGEIYSFDISTSLDIELYEMIESYSLQATCEQPYLLVSRAYCKVPQSAIYQDSSITIGENVSVKGQIRGMSYGEYVIGAEVYLTYSNPSGTSIIRMTTSGEAGHFYDDDFKPDGVGEWSVTARWAGNEIFDGAESSQFIFTVRTEMEHANAIISKAQNTIAFTEDQGIKAVTAKVKLEDAKNAYENGNYSEAIQLATLAEELANKETRDATEASSMIGLARNSIEKARAEKRILGLDEAQELLEQAEDEHSKGNYEQSIQLSEEAKIKAENTIASQFNYLWIIIGISLGVGLTILTIFWRIKTRSVGRKKRSSAARKPKRLKQIDHS